MSELMLRPNDERAGRPVEDNAMHQILTMMIDTADAAGQKKFQIQAKANSGCFAGQSPHMFQINQSAVLPPMRANSHPPSQKVLTPRVPTGYPIADQARCMK